jgi:D-arginine dehydrogenase
MTGRTIAVVGAGIAGCLIARELAARDPQAQVTVLDRDLVGSGVTRRSAGVSLVRGSTPRTARMSRLSHDYYAALLAADPQLPIHPVSARLILTGETTPGQPGQPGQADPADPAALGYSPGHTGSEATGLTDQFDNEIRLPAGTRLYRIGGCHHADVYALAQALAARARQAGKVRFAESVRVTGLTVTGSGVAVSTSEGRQRTFDQAVLAPGPWIADPAWRHLLSPLGLRVKKIVAMHLDRPPKPDDELIIFEAEDAFLLPVAHRGHWLLSYTRIEWDVEPDAIASGAGLSPEDVEAARAVLRPYSPALADACVSGRVCCDAYSPSREPVVTTLDGTDGRIVFAGAANGSGYRLAPAIATEAVNLLYDPTPASQGATDDHQHV